MSNGEGWDDRRRAHSDGVGVGIKGQNRHHTHYCSSMVFVGWVQLALKCCSVVTLCALYNVTAAIASRGLGGLRCTVMGLCNQKTQGDLHQ